MWISRCRIHETYKWFVWMDEKIFCNFCSKWKTGRGGRVMGEINLKITVSMVTVDDNAVLTGACDLRYLFFRRLLVAAPQPVTRSNGQKCLEMQKTPHSHIMRIANQCRITKSLPFAPSTFMQSTNRRYAPSFVMLDKIFNWTINIYLSSTPQMLSHFQRRKAQPFIHDFDVRPTTQNYVIYVIA